MKFLSRLSNSSGFWFILFLIETLVLAYLSLVKAPTLRIGPDEENRIAHLAAYAIYGGTCMLWRISGKSGITSFRSTLPVMIWSIIYGIVMEAGQLLLPERDPDILDGLCNVMGAICGCLAGLKIRMYLAKNGITRNL